MAWEFIITDRYGDPLGELIDASQRAITLPLNRAPTGNFTLRNDNPLLPVLREMDVTLVKAYRDGVLYAVGPIAPTYHKKAQSGNLTTQFFWSGVSWRMSLRVIEQSKSVKGVSYGTATSTMDRADIAASIINGLNSAALPAGVPAVVADTGIRVDPNITSGTIRTTQTYVGPWYYKNALQAILELSATLDGFDWKIIPVEPVADSVGIHLGTFTTGTPNLGQARPNAVFEYGDGRYNVSSFDETGENSGLLNRAFSLPNGFPDATSTQMPLSQFDATSMILRGTVYEDIVQSDFVSDDLRNRLLLDHIAVRAYPRQIITFQPAVDTPIIGITPKYGTDYVEGDTVQFRAVEFGQETINAIFRIYQIQFDIDQQGNESATPTLVSQNK